uniref:Ig-like domain-containing protein n=1 Tax=Bubo bubo TaxID=30461 RepID=A0A8C0FP01_BUBBB
VLFVKGVQPNVLLIFVVLIFLCSLAGGVVGNPCISLNHLDYYKASRFLSYGVSFIDGLATLKVTQARVSDSGIYVCEAHNDAGSESCSVELKVKEPPVFSRKPSPVDMLKGTEVNLECEISGTPPFDVTWYKDRRQIRSSKKYKVTAKNYHTSVRILNVEAADVGEYQCKAQNDVGSDTCFCTVKLKGKVLAHMLSTVLPMALHCFSLHRHCEYLL